MQVFLEKKLYYSFGFVFAKNIDINIYMYIVKNTPVALRKITKSTAIAIKANLSKLFFIEKSLNFKAKSGNSETNNKQLITNILNKNIKLFDKSCINEKCFPFEIEIHSKDATTIAFAGVGNPKNTFDCLVSKLNFAKRNAEKAGIATLTYGRTVCKSLKIKG